MFVGVGACSDEQPNAAAERECVYVRSRQWLPPRRPPVGGGCRRSLRRRPCWGGEVGEGGGGGGRWAGVNCVAGYEHPRRRRRLAGRTRRWRNTRYCHPQPTAVGGGGARARPTSGGERFGRQPPRALRAATAATVAGAHADQREGWSPDSFPSGRGQEAPLPASSWVVFSSRWRQNSQRRCLGRRVAAPTARVYRGGQGTVAAAAPRVHLPVRLCSLSRHG